MPRSRRGKTARWNLESNDAFTIHLELVNLFERHPVVRILGDLVLQTPQSNARHLGFLSIGSSLYLPVVRDAEEKPAAFRVAQVGLVAESGEILADIFEIIILLCGLVLDDLGLNVGDNTQEQRGHLTRFPYHGAPN